MRLCASSVLKKKTHKGIHIYIYIHIHIYVCSRRVCDFRHFFGTEVLSEPSLSCISVSVGAGRQLMSWTPTCKKKKKMKSGARVPKQNKKKFTANVAASASVAARAHERASERASAHVRSCETLAEPELQCISPEC